MHIVEEYEKVIEGEYVNFVVQHDQDQEFPYYVISSSNIDGAGMSSQEAKEKCVNATKLEILINK